VNPESPVHDTMPSHPTVFISYSWDDEAHKEWVRQLATELRADGVDARLDLWHAVPGDQLPNFMEREIRESDYVIVICTPKYKAKSDNRAGGVGYEGNIMAAEVLAKQNHCHAAALPLSMEQPRPQTAQKLFPSRIRSLVGSRVP